MVGAQVVVLDVLQRKWTKRRAAVADVLLVSVRPITAFVETVVHNNRYKEI